MVSKKQFVVINELFWRILQAHFKRRISSAVSNSIWGIWAGTFELNLADVRRGTDEQDCVPNDKATLPKLYTKNGGTKNLNRGHRIHLILWN